MTTITLLPQDRIVQRFIQRYIVARYYLNESEKFNQVKNAMDLTNMHCTIACFGDCFDLTFAEAETYLKEHTP